MRGRSPAGWLAVALLAGCGSDGTPPAARRFEDPGRVEGSRHRMYYALTLSEDLPAEIAATYGIKRRPNLALLTVATQRAGDDGAWPPAELPLVAERESLLGDRQRLLLRSTGSGSWIAELEVRDREAVTIEIVATTGDGTPPLRARMTREFDLD